MRRVPMALGLLAAVLAVAVTTALIYPLSEAVPVVSTGVVYLISVLIVSSRWGLWPGILTAVLGAAAWNFFHLPPTGEFEIEDGENWVALVVFLVAAIMTSTLAEGVRRVGRIDRDEAPDDLSNRAHKRLGGQA